MLRSVLLSLFAIDFVKGFPALDISDLVARNSTSKTLLREYEVLVYENDHGKYPDFTIYTSTEVVHQDDYLKILESKGIQSQAPPIDESWLNFTSENNLQPRDDCLSTIIVTDRTERFVDWDVQMSPVIIGAGTGIDVFVANSYSVGNSISVSTGVDYTIMEKVLAVSLSIDYTYTWTTTTLIQTKVTVLGGQAGVMITMPFKNRRYGRSFCGRPGALVQTGTWIADSYESQDYNGVGWISGAITGCIKNQTTLPLTRCHGEGEFI